MTLGGFGSWYFAVLNPTKIPGKASLIFCGHRDKQIYGVITRGSRVNESKYQELIESGRSERGKEWDSPFTEARQSASNRISSQITRIGVWATHVRSIAQAARWPEKDGWGVVTPLLACFESALHTRARDNSPSLHPPAPSLQIPPPSTLSPSPCPRPGRHTDPSQPGRRTAEIGYRKAASVNKRRVKTGGEGQQSWDHIRLVACSDEGAGSAGLPFREQAMLESGMYRNTAAHRASQPVYCDIPTNPATKRSGQFSFVQFWLE
jgi:hypothetical protein